MASSGHSCSQPPPQGHTSMASYGHPNLPFSAVCQPSCSQQAAQGHTSIVSYGRPSLPFASPKILQTLKTLQTLQTLATLQTLTNSNDSPKPDQSLLLGVPGCRLPPFSFTTPSLTENWLPQTVRWSIFPVLTSLATFPLQTGQM